jgi:hypothetical protein
MPRPKTPVYTATITVTLKVRNPNIVDAKAIAIAIKNQVKNVAKSAAKSTAVVVYTFNENPS